MIEDHTLLMSDGRELGYGEFGHQGHKPLLYIHGTPSARLNPSALLIEKILIENTELPFRVFAVERPGYGLSDPADNWTMQQWIKDIHEFTDHLGIQCFSLVGISGGGPYALACAHAFGSRVQKTAILAGMGPVYIDAMAELLSAQEQERIRAARHSPEILNELASRIHQDPYPFIRTALNDIPKEERKKIPEEMITGYEAALYEATFHGSGLIADYRNFSKHWGFEAETIRTPVHFWHSKDDKTVPFAHSQFLSEQIPSAELTALSGLNHFMSTTVPLPEVLSYLMK